ncbi:DUF1839 family protein [Methylobacterium sp. J-076]|uniref:DUF1839 family protein n=1 Tax=Methylobacterium sp. J-076 TaxID=2836655 RepID=UPI001FBA9939|nr:DUF1839 family protein [Methylobacterium sp. J-076]MCJ2015486.1 DUF1839 family protein [Methylobacterium sp. J-076]
MSAALANGLALRDDTPDAPAYAAHPLHGQDRAWPETNCYVDLWIELLHHRGRVPEAMLGFTVRQDFEGDQFTFFKPSMAEIEALYGLRLDELAIYDGLERHALIQAARGNVVLVEVDAIHLPDTAGTTYGREHSKTTIGILAIDKAGRRLDYLHNAGRFQLSGDDYDGIFAETTLPPYAEFVRPVAEPLPPDDLPKAALGLLRANMRHAPGRNPVAAFAAALGEAGEPLVQRPLSVFHKYAFNTTRQLGANFEMLGSHLSWLTASGAGEFTAAAEAATRLGGEAKAFQFQLARAFAKRSAAGLPQRLERATATYDDVFGALRHALA